MHLLNYDELKKLHREKRGSFEEGFSIRLHRALSWLHRAEQEENDYDAGFIFYWISFNANYAVKQIGLDKISEGQQFREFFDQITSVDETNLIYAFVWKHFTNEIRSILNNEFIYSSFWHAEETEYSGGWKEGFESAKFVVGKALANQDTQLVLQILFSRLYTLRNQLIHGNATWNGGLNRQQVTDGYKLLSHLQPIFIYLMLNNPEENWGNLAFPIIKELA